MTGIHVAVAAPMQEKRWGLDAFEDRPNIGMQEQVQYRLEIPRPPADAHRVPTSAASRRRRPSSAPRLGHGSRPESFPVGVEILLLQHPEAKG